MTALEADTTRCLLEISLVVWHLDALGMLDFHRQVWEHTQARAIDGLDVRLPSQGPRRPFGCQESFLQRSLRQFTDV